LRTRPGALPGLRPDSTFRAALVQELNIKEAS
jgi:hypothetical protein